MKVDATPEDILAIVKGTKEQGEDCLSKIKQKSGSWAQSKAFGPAVKGNDKRAVTPVKRIVD